MNPGARSELLFRSKLRGLDPVGCVADAVHATQLEEKAFDPIATLSRGFKQRVGVAQAILHKPKFLILDEPSNGLDPTQTQHMRELIRTLAQDATVILSTHIMQEVKAVCDRVIILRSGQLAVDERLDTLQQTSGLKLTTAPEVDAAALLGAVPGINGVSNEAPGQWEIDVQGDIEAGADAIARALVAANAPIHALAPHLRDLETIFREVSEGQTSEVQDAA